MKVITLLIIGLSLCWQAMAQESREMPFEPGILVNAIYQAEDSSRYPYGIKSINTHGDKEYARQICLNTVRNNWKRYLKTTSQPSFKGYLGFLGARYCPTVGKGLSMAENSLNKHWMGNVEYYYELFDNQVREKL